MSNTKTITRDAATAVRGYVPGSAVRTKWVSCDWTEDANAPDGVEAEAFRAKIRRGLTFDQIDAIPLGGEATWADLYEAIAPMVLEWNAVAVDAATDEVSPLPPPAEAGPDVFRLIEPDLVVWLAWRLKLGHLEAVDLPKGRTPSGTTPEPSSAST